MKAWEYTRDKTFSAPVVILPEEQQTWTLIAEGEKASDALLLAQWSSRVPGSAAPESVIAGAVQSLESLGYDVGESEKILEEGLAALERGDTEELSIITARLYRSFDSLPRNPRSERWNYQPYDTFEDYRRGVVFPQPRLPDLTGPAFRDKTRAAWLGRLAGGALGTALEGYVTAQLLKKFGDIRGYVREPNTYNDDITYEIAFLTACLKTRREVSSADIAEQWLALIPSGWSAEQAALDNLRKGIYPPESGTYKNPFREWIGAQMRGAICGQVAPGNPEKAARLAWTDGVISHSGNGVLGEVFNAVLTSLAFVRQDMRGLLKEAIALIPRDSEYAGVLDFALTQARGGSFETAWAACEQRYQKYNWIHAYPNAAAEVAAFWFGEGDFDETMRLIALCGQDVDCNAAQMGAVLGAMKGTAAIDSRWYAPLGQKISTYLRGSHKEIDLEELIGQTVEAAGR
ncbi:MAG: ADP-ribosylglycohydrolase family protein [Spirochaetales bacterium]|jgi:ADP-ribosylglycohydrolase|nr:ADP-ribosylglycohydrolase family protein [Spirochaetales bacterium]